MVTAIIRLSTQNVPCLDQWGESLRCPCLPLWEHLEENVLGGKPRNTWEPLALTPRHRVGRQTSGAMLWPAGMIRARHSQGGTPFLNTP